MSLDSSSMSLLREAMLVQAKWARTESLGAAGIWLAVSSGAELTRWAQSSGSGSQCKPRRLQQQDGWMQKAAVLAWCLQQVRNTKMRAAVGWVKQVAIVLTELPLFGYWKTADGN